VIVVKPYAISACALFIIGTTSRWRRAACVTDGGVIECGAAFCQRPNTPDATSCACDGVTSPTMAADRSVGANRRSWRVSRSSRVRVSTISIDPFVLRPYGWPSGYSSAINDSVARTAGLSSSCRIEVITCPLRLTISRSGSDGVVTISPSSASTGSKSSARQVVTSEKRWRVTEMVIVMPRLSSASAMSAAVRLAVPRSITRESSHAVPGTPGGSAADPARITRLIATAGVVVVCFASTTTPLSSIVRVGASPACMTGAIMSPATARTSRRCGSTPRGSFARRPQPRRP
jgi:hypothetical protein